MLKQPALRDPLELAGGSSFGQFFSRASSPLPGRDVASILRKTHGKAMKHPTRFLVLSLFLAGLVRGAEERPNILFLFSDDQRADTIACLGNEHIRTPTLDRLAQSGTVFTRAYCMGSWVAVHRCCVLEMNCIK